MSCEIGSSTEEMEEGESYESVSVRMTSQNLQKMDGSPARTQVPSPRSMGRNHTMKNSGTET